jgi:hypothetical protein
MHYLKSKPARQFRQGAIGFDGAATTRGNIDCDASVLEEIKRFERNSGFDQITTKAKIIH